MKINEKPEKTEDTFVTEFSEEGCKLDKIRLICPSLSNYQFADISMIISHY